ncbi:MAG: hypothetical protein WDO14_14565 [Bacteroidota bacterium]
MKEFTIYDLRCTIWSWRKIVPRTSYLVRGLLFVAFIFLAFNAFSQVGSDSVRRPVRTKTAVPISPTQKSRKGSSIVNDSSRNPYGPATTRWTTEREMFTAKTNFRPLDTSINNYHRWTYVQKSANFLHDLGNNGTALNPIFPVVPANIGATPGFNAYARTGMRSFGCSTLNLLTQECMLCGADKAGPPPASNTHATSIRSGM